MTSPGNLLLQWASENGAGKLRDLLDAISWVARTYSLDVTRGAAGRWIRDSSAMGFLDVDWIGGQWSVAPSVLTRLPASDGLLLLTGSRTAATVDRLKAAYAIDAEVAFVENRGSASDIPCPDTILISDDREMNVPELARRLGALWIPCFALQMADLIQPITEGRHAAAPGPGAVLERFDLEMKRFSEVRKADEDGLYRFERADHKRPCQLLRDGEWFQTTYEQGIFLELASKERKPYAPIRWTPEKNVGREGVGMLVVDWGTPLPPLQGRMATLCTGLTPILTPVSDFGFTKYESVPRNIAKSIANSLRQSLAVY